MKKNLLITVLVFLAIVLLLNTIFGWFTPSKKEILADEYSKPKTDTIRLEYHSDSTIVKYMPNVGQSPANNITKNYRTYVYDTLAPALKIATGKISELQQIKATLEGTVNAQKIIIDNQKNRLTYYNGKYFSATTKTDTVGNSDLDYKYQAQLDIVTEDKSKLWGKEKQEVTITSPDKNFRINGVEHFKKEIFIPTKRFGLGLQTGYYFVPETGKFVPAIGVGFSYNLFRF